MQTIRLSGSAAVAIDDATANDDRALTAIARTVSGGVAIENVNAWSLKRTTDATWSASAGLGGTFSAGGVWVGIYVDPTASASYPFVGKPTAGVTAARSGLASPADDFYFSDTAPFGRTGASAVQTSTGTNGTALLRNGSGLAQYAGQGAEPAACTWSSHLAATPAGLVFVQEDVAACP